MAKVHYGGGQILPAGGVPPVPENRWIPHHGLVLDQLQGALKFYHLFTDLTVFDRWKLFFWGSEQFCECASTDITPVRLREKLVGFYLPDVLQELREKAKTSKQNVARRA